MSDTTAAATNNPSSSDATTATVATATITTTDPATTTITASTATPTPPPSIPHRRRSNQENTNLFNSVANHPNFKVSWDNRRRIVSGALIISAVVLMMITMTICFDAIMRIELTDSAEHLLFTLITADFGLSTAVIGSYVFGAAWDINNFRANLTNFASKVKDE